MVIPSEYKDYEFGVSAHTQIELPEHVTPKKYFQFALDDIKDIEKEGARVNAVSNSKRALHFQVDLISEAFGIGKMPSSKRKKFHDKLAHCRKCGIVGSRILRKLNKVRNLVEHEYYVPSVDETEEFIDIVELFLTATDRFVFNFPEDLEFQATPSEEDVPEIDGIFFPIGSGEICLIKTEARPKIEKELHGAKDFNEWMKSRSIVFNTSRAEYFEWVQFLVENTV